MESRSHRLRILHEEIDRCRVCELDVNPLRKPQDLDRGDPGRVVIVGEGPGAAELAESQAFAGPSGERLEEWLVACGAAPEEPRRDIYFTSVAKCVKGSEADLRVMMRNCRHFLDSQLSILQPRLIITLGQHAYRHLLVSDDTFSDALCRIFHSQDHFLVPLLGFHHHLLVWPHPSPSNRWHNEPANREHLGRSFDLARPFLGQHNVES